MSGPTTDKGAKPAEFGKWRGFFWPVHSYELKKILPMFIMFFFISMNYALLRICKDAIIQYAPGSGSFVLPYLKFWGVVPVAFIFMIIYSKLSNILRKETLFYASVVPFIVFFALYMLYLQPNSTALHFGEYFDVLSQSYPWAAGFFAIFRNWTFSLFYIFAELWGSVALSLLFWGFANDITKPSEAKRFYALFGLGANIALLTTKPIVAMIKILANGVETVENDITIVIVIISSFLIIGIYRWITTNVLTDPRFYSPEEIKAKKDKPAMTLTDSFKVLVRSKHLLFITVIVFAYNISIVLIEVLWKAKATEYFSTASAYKTFQADYNQITAWCTICLMLFVTSNSLRKFGWGFTALVTPVVLLITGIGFFVFVIFQDSLSGLVDHFGCTALALAVIFGTLQNAVSKASKYSLFDPTKEMAYIPLDQESKVKGKAAIDVVGARVGKALGSGFNQVAISFFKVGSISAVSGQAIPMMVIAPITSVIFFTIVIGWIWAVKGLDKSLKGMGVN